MSKGILTHDSLVWLHWHVHQRAHHTARRPYLLCVDIGLYAQVGVGLEYHGHLLERCVASTLAYAVDGHLHLSCAVQHTCYGVGCRHTQVVVAVGREYRLACCEGINVLVEVLNLLAILVRSAETRCVRYVTYRSTSLRHSLYHASQILVVCSACILSIELYVLHILLGIFHSSHGTLYYLLRRAVKLILDVRRTGAYASVYALMLSVL